MFRALVFVILDSGFIPRCALEVSDTAQVRIHTITNIISECRYGIHDISRSELDPEYSLPRFNMPLELGIFLGCRKFGGRLHRSKACLVFDREKYRYQKFISDIAGQNVQSHDGLPATAVRGVRDFLRTASGQTNIPGGAKIWERYDAFQNALPTLCKTLKIRLDELTFLDLTHLITEWLRQVAPQG